MHLKREQSPKNWPIERKGTTYLVRPRYNIEKGVPILLIIRDILKLAKDRRETKKALNAKQVLLNNRIVFDDRDNALLFDVVTILPAKGSSLSEKYYRIEINKNKKFTLTEINSKEANHKTAKIINKTVLKGKKTQLNLSDGRNFLSEIKCRVNDSLLINLKDKKIEECISLQKGAKAIVFAGKHMGETGIIQEVHENDVKLERDGEIVNILIKQLMVLK
jgi:small subunit ribosomal protein S4e